MSLAPLLNRITELIVRVCEPDQVVLFGSHAKGTADRNSDIDILVVAEFRASRHLRGRELRESLYSVAIPIDIVCVTPRELETDRQVLHGFLNSAMEKAVVLYCKPGIAQPNEPLGVAP